MTLITGCFFAGGLILSSDSEENTEFGGKRSVTKLSDSEIGDSARMAIGASGISALCDIVIQRLEEVAKKSGPTFGGDHYHILTNELRQIHADYVDKPERHLNLIIGLHDLNRGQLFLYRTTEEMLQPQKQYACIGAGQEIAFYLMDRLYERDLNEEEIVQLLAFIFRETKDSVGGVGKQTYMVRFRENKTWSLIAIGQGELHAPTLKSITNHFWKEGRIKPSASEKSK